MTDDRGLGIRGMPHVVSLEIVSCVFVRRGRNQLFTCEVKPFHPLCFCSLNCLCTSVPLCFLDLQISNRQQELIQQGGHYLHSHSFNSTVKHGRRFESMKSSGRHMWCGGIGVRMQGQLAVFKFFPHFFLACICYCTSPFTTKVFLS